MILPSVLIAGYYQGNVESSLWCTNINRTAHNKNKTGHRLEIPEVTLSASTQLMSCAMPLRNGLE